MPRPRTATTIRRVPSRHDATAALRAPLPLWYAVALAVASGPVLVLAFPGRDWWPLAFVGLGMLLVALRGRRPAAAYLVGFAGGVSFFLFLVQWTALYLGPVPWIALATLQALLMGVGGLAIALAYRLVPRVWPGVWGRLGLTPIVVAGLWTGREWLTGTWPYGGFSWGRLSESQSQSPFAALVAWLGMSGLTFVVAWLTALALECWFEGRVALISRAVIAVGAAALVLAVPAWPATTHGTTRIAAVQGNGPAGYFDRAAPGDVMNTQISETLKITDTRLYMVVWPEGAADLDPTANPSSARVLDYLSTRYAAPFIVGTITQRDGRFYNTSLLWKAGKGAVALYDKKHPVPFGEYVPDRAFWRQFAPSLIDLIGRDYTPGSLPNTFRVNGVTVGLSICFDIVDDQLQTDMMTRGAQVIVAQTNNADFGRTDENKQQLAIARLRAIEGARSLVNISTVGSSQIIDPSGRTIAKVPAYTAAHMVADVPLGTATTPATLYSRQIEVAVSLFGLAALLMAAALARRRGTASRGGGAPRR